MRLRAAAKINWTLEVLGRREDGYHEVRTVLQTIDLCDTLEFEPADELTLEVHGPHEPSEDDLVLRAARRLNFGERRGALVLLTKRIPVASGLGGGSSDAAATLSGLNRLWGLGRDEAALEGMAAELGSDVPFLLRGGCALAEGRGELVTPLPDPPAAWVVLLVPPLAIADKTATMYAALTPDDFSDGSTTAALAERIRRGVAVDDAALRNAFDRVAYERFEGLASYRDTLLAAGATSVYVAGAGPALFALVPDEAAAREILARLRSPGGQAFAARTLTPAEALAEGV